MQKEPVVKYPGLLYIVTEHDYMSYIIKPKSLGFIFYFIQIVFDFMAFPERLECGICELNNSTSKHSV